MKKICILVRTVGPYHHARFNALCKHFNICVFETRPNIGEYDWKAIESNESLYNLYKNTSKSGDYSKDLIINYLNNSCPDYIITHGWADTEYLIALLYAKRKKIPIYTLTDSTLIDFKRNKIKELLKSYIAKCFDGYLAAGTRSIEYLHSLGIQNNILTPCDVVDNEYFSCKADSFRTGKEKVSISLPQNYILCVSRFIAKKNLLALLSAYYEAIRICENYKYNLVIVGSGPIKEEIECKIRDLKLENRVFLYNFAQYSQLPQFYAGASALIIPSISDQWGLVVNEAMACNLPVLVSKNCGCSVDLVQEEKNGFVFSPEKDSICGVLCRFNTITNNNIAEMGMKSFSIISNYTLDVHVNAVKGMLKVNHVKLNILQRVLIFIITK